MIHSAITSASIAYTIAKACSMGELVECSCDKNLVKHNVLLSDKNVPDDSQMNHPFISKRNRSKKPKKNGNKRPRKANKRKAPQMPEFPGMGETWEWSGCDDNVNFGNRKSKDFLDSRFRRRSDIKTLVRIQNNDAGRLVSKVFVNLLSETKCISSNPILSPYFNLPFSKIFFFSHKRLLITIWIKCHQYKIT